MIYGLRSDHSLPSQLLTREISVALRQKRARRTAATNAAIPTLVHEAQVTTLINLAARLTGKAARKRMGSIGAWPGQIPLLLWLLEKKQLVQKELVQVTGMEQSTVAEHLERMERDRLVTRRRGSEDRRQ